MATNPEPTGTLGHSQGHMLLRSDINPFVFVLPDVRYINEILLSLVKMPPFPLILSRGKIKKNCFRNITWLQTLGDTESPLIPPWLETLGWSLEEVGKHWTMDADPSSPSQLT